MKKLNLDQTWKLCMSMWWWIVKKKKKRSRYSVGALKEQWLEKHRYKADEIDNDCFFCAYDERYKDDCSRCPARIVDGEQFHCSNAAYSWSYKPILFYEKLKELNRKRLAKRKK